jgi:hypothetical protein
VSSHFRLFLPLSPYKILEEEEEEEEVRYIGVPKTHNPTIPQFSESVCFCFFLFSFYFLTELRVVRGFWDTMT